MALTYLALNYPAVQHPHSFLINAHQYMCLILGTKVSSLSKSTKLRHMWQSRVKIEHHSVAYFARITAFEAL